jgi:F-type H+-transporting ATPase subunit b
MQRSQKWSKITSVGLALLGVMITAGVVYAAADGDYEILSREKLWDLFWRILNFAILLFLLIKFGSKPIANALSGRRQSIRDQFENLDLRKSEAEQLYKEYEGKLARLDEEVQKIIAAAVSQGQMEKDRIIEAANRAADDIRKHADLAVQQRFAEANSKLREEIAEQAAAMAEEIVGKNLQQADQAKLIEEYLNKVEGVK